MEDEQLVEIEIKTLLGEKENADRLENLLKKREPLTKLLQISKQLNHYFLPGSFTSLLKNIKQHLDRKEAVKLTQIIKEGNNHHTRTRKQDDDVILVIKATIDDTTSSNGTARLEYETTFKNLTLDQLDTILLDSEFAYEAKWSRDRKEYKYKDYIVSIDRNAGYGYLSEFEKVVPRGENVDQIKQQIRNELKELGLIELPQDRLGRMFAYYNANWRDYYGTDKTFIVE